MSTQEKVYWNTVLLSLVSHSLYDVPIVFICDCTLNQWREFLANVNWDVSDVNNSDTNSIYSSTLKFIKFPFAARSYQQSPTGNLEHNDDVSSFREERSRNRGRGVGWYDPFADLSEAEEALDLPHLLGGAHNNRQQSSRNGGHSTGLYDSTYSEEVEAIQDLLDWFNRSVAFYLFTVPESIEKRKWKMKIS